MLRMFMMVYSMILKKISPPSGESFVASERVRTIWTGSEEDYEQISTPDVNTLYFIEEET